MDPNLAASNGENATRRVPIPASRGRRVAVLLGVAALAGGGVAAALVVAGGGDDPAPAGRTAARPLSGVPPLVVELAPAGDRSRTDRVLATFAHGVPPAAEGRLAKLPRDDPRVDVARALAAYGDGGPAAALAALRRLPQDDAVVVLHEGLVEAWRGDVGAAADLWRRARELDRFGFYGVRADNLLHPEQLPSLPGYLPEHAGPRLSPAELRAGVERQPRDSGRWLALATGLPLERRPEAVAAAERAVALAPDAVAPRVALAVLRYSKDDPARSVGTLGQLAAQAPDNAEIRFHFALLLLWLRRNDDALAQFREARADDPGGRYGRASDTFLRELG